MNSKAFYEYLLKRGFERRKSQEKMIEIVEETIENEEVSLIEAPTGTGKTFAYLIPIITRGEKAIISTGTKILQDQLKRDIEFLLSHYKLLTGKNVSYTVIKGKGNYLCLDRFYKEEINPAEKLEIEMLIEGTWDGDLTLTSLPPETIAKINVDDDYCTFAYRQACPYFNECYYWNGVKRRERNADILVINHSLLALKEFDTENRVLVIDEAHELDKYLTLATTFPITLYGLYELKKDIEKVLGREINVNLQEFFVKNFEEKFEDEKEIPLNSLEEYKEEFEEKIYHPLKNAVNDAINQIKLKVRKFLEERLMISFTLKEFLINSLFTEDELIDVKAGYEELTEEEREIIKLVKKVDYFNRKIKKLKIFLQLMEKQQSELGYKVSRVWSKKLNGYNYRIEVFQIFPNNVIDTEDYKAVVITSATVDPEDIHLTTGITGNYYQLSHNYDYSDSQIIIESTNPKMEDWKDKLMTAYYILRDKYKKVLVLLTNKEHLKYFDKDEEVGIQGEDSLTKLIELVRNENIKVLIGLDSLWTGVDIKGEKGILMSKLPFENPNDPLTYHRLRYLEEMGLNPFDYQRKKAFIKFRQGVGRLVRQSSDKGTIILCDNRIWRYREFIDFLRSIGINIISKGRFKKAGRFYYGKGGYY